MRSQKDRLVIDTNLWISFLLTKNLSKLDILISSNKVTFIFSKELLEELIEVTQRSKFRKYFDFDDIENLLLQIKKRAIFITIKSETNICRDAKDNFILSLAFDGKATHIITGDKDLLVLKKFGRTKILTISEYFGQN